MKWIFYLLALMGCTVPGSPLPVVPDPTPPAPAVTAAPVTVPARADVDVMVWCGADPADPSLAGTTVRSFAFHGVDITFGPCRDPGPGYTPAFTGTRYASPEDYMELVELNASVGMRTMVYDARLWDADPAIQGAAVAFWAPVTSSIAGWDMGDEFDPSGPEWAILIDRWHRVEALGTGVRPFTNHLPNGEPWGSAIEAWLRDMPDAAAREISFDSYDAGVAHAEAYRDRTALMTCAFNAYQHAHFAPTAASVAAEMEALEEAGCDRLLAFGGARLNIGDFGDTLLDKYGNATGLLVAVGRST